MFTYKDFIYIKDNEGKYKYVDCSKRQSDYWEIDYDWKDYDKNDTIVVFNYQGRLLLDTFFFELAFTTKENFENRFNEKFDFNKICRIFPTIHTFIEAQEYLCRKFGYKKENILEETGNINQKYRLGIFDY